MFLLPRSCRVARSVPTIWKPHSVKGEVLAAPASQRLAAFATRSHNVAYPHTPFTIRQQIRNENCRSTKALNYQARSISLEAPREPVAGSEPGVNVQSEDSWPQWRKKSVQVSIQINFVTSPSIPIC